MTSLLARLMPRRVPRITVPVTVYTRKECCCCHKALDILNLYRRKYSLAIELVDVDGDPALAREHGLTVPVVAIDGKVRFKGVVNAVLLERILTNRDV